MQKWKISSQELVKIKTIKDVFDSNTPVLSVIKRDYGEEFLLTYIALWISGINKFAGGKLTDDDCISAAELIYEDFYFLKIADLKLIAKRLKKRKFVRVTGNEIYNEIEIYFNERCKQAQSYSKEQSDKYKNSLDIIELNNKEIKKLYKDVASGKKLSDSISQPKRNSEREIDKHKKAILFYEAYRKDNPNPNE